MKKFYQMVVNHSKLVLIIYAVLFVCCALAQQGILVDYDMNDYLPEDSASTVAINLMNEEFGSGIPNARVMVEDVTIPQALAYKEKIKAVDGVTDVTWLDDAVSVETPLETMDTNTVENYYKDGNALFSVTIESEKKIEAVNAIREIIGEENAMTGSAVSTATATQSTVKEIGKIAGIAVAFVLLVLVITTDSWLEPVILMIGLGTLKTDYGKFDTAITTLAGNLTTLAGNMTTLKSGIDELVKNYTALDSGIGEYTKGVAALASGYGQLVDGVSQLASGSKELFPKIYRLVGETDIDKTYSMPKSYISYRKPRQLSAKQRELARKHMEKINRSN